MAPEEVVGISTQEVIFYLATFVTGAAAGAVRVARDREYQSLSNFIGVTGSSVLLAFAVVALWVGRNGATVGSEFRLLAVAVAVGLLGKEQDKLLRWGLAKAAKALGIELEQLDDDETG